MSVIINIRNSFGNVNETMFSPPLFGQGMCHRAYLTRSFRADVHDKVRPIVSNGQQGLNGDCPPALGC